MSKITKVQKYAICWLNSINKTSLDIADELSLTEKQVLSVLEKTAPTKTQETIEISATSAPVAAKVSSKDLMINQTFGKKTNSVSIMTKEASELNDELRKKIVSDTSKLDQQKGIFRPKQ